MSQTPYNAISQGPAIIPMDNYGVQQRITPAPQGWCTPRRIKIIVAIVIMTILWIALIGVWVWVKTEVTRQITDSQWSTSYSYSHSYDR